MRLKFYESTNVYVAPKRSTSLFSPISQTSSSSSSSSSSLLYSKENELEKIRSTNCLSGMRRYYKLVFLIFLTLSALLFYLTFIRTPVSTKSVDGVSNIDGLVKTRKINAEDELVKCEIYMESQCTDTTSFFETQLWPAWPKIKSFVDLKLIPYGKARETTKGHDDYNFRCQHGNTECLVNQMMCCGMKRMNFVTERYLPFVKCLQGEQPSALRRCCERSDLLLSDIENCANGLEGRQIHHEMGNLTRQLSPQMNFVPWIVVNGKREKEAFNNFLKILCQKYDKLPKPAVC